MTSAMLPIEIANSTHKRPLCGHCAPALAVNPANHAAPAACALGDLHSKKTAACQDLAGRCLFLDMSEYSIGAVRFYLLFATIAKLLSSFSLLNPFVSLSLLMIYNAWRISVSVKFCSDQQAVSFTYFSTSSIVHLSKTWYGQPSIS